MDELGLLNTSPGVPILVFTDRALVLSVLTVPIALSYSVIRSSVSRLVPETARVGAQGGDELNRKLIENLTRKQATLGNLAPGQRFSLANRGKSIKAIFDAAGAMRASYSAKHMD